MRPFWFAVHGIVHAARTERNMRVHLVASILVGIFAWFLPTTRVENIVLFGWVILVIAFELMNTAVERTVDLVTSEVRPLAKQAKDVAAGAVLVASFGAAVTALAVFGPYLLALL
ncbi:diacylglycerol kinase [Exiguobacterium sp.]|uniref:diacylglycerol kinase family protein n=1 Tax=Exiguobacterium sp. TaxID=44751 RepID=UPI002A0935D1|nr:diacylglycerol kinase family protein [Exiguobacterium sp.]